MTIDWVRRNAILLLLFSLLAGHFAWLASYVAPGYASPDADGYFAQARMIASEGSVTFEAESPLRYLGIHWLEKEDGTFISRYPPGLPSMLAAAWLLLGRSAVFYVNPLLATLTLLFLFLLCRPWVGEKLAVAAALAYAVVPLANYHAIHSDAHTAAACFLVAGFWLLDRWARLGGKGPAITAGLVLGMVPAIRYAEAVAALGIIVFVLMQLRREKERRFDLPWLAAGALLPAGLLMFHNHVHFGAFWRTGYALTHEQQITWEYFRQNWHSYLDALLASGLGPLVALGLAGLAAMISRRQPRALAIGLLLTTGAISAVYAGYYFNRGPLGASIRFLLPTMPLYLLPAMWLFRELGDATARRAALMALLVIQVVRGVPSSAERMRTEYEGAERSSIALAWFDANIPEGSVIVASQRIHNQLHFTGKWKQADASVIQDSGRGFGPGFGPPGRGMFGGADQTRPTPRQVGKAEKLRAKYEGLTAGERARAAVEDLRQWAGEEGAIYWVGSESEVRRLARMAGEQGLFEKMGEIDLSGSSLEPGASGNQIGGRGNRGDRRRMMMRRGRGGGPGPGPGAGSGGKEGFPGEFDRGRGGFGRGFGPPGRRPSPGMRGPGGGRRGPGGGGNRFGIPAGTYEVFKMVRR